MTPKEKAIELVNRYLQVYDGRVPQAKKCVLIAVDEILKINAIKDIFVYEHYKNDYQSLYKYWKEVEQEIINL